MNTNRSYPPTPRPSSWSSSPRTTPGAPIDDEARKELLATLAASRDLGPEMDHTLADRYLERQTQRQARFAQWQAPSRRLAGANLRRFWPLAIALAAGLGALMLMAVMMAVALHGGPPHGFDHTGFGPHDGQGATSATGAADGDHDGFFPLFGLFFWALPVLALILFLRRRAAMRRARYSRVAGGGPAAMGGARPYRSQSLPTAQSEGPYAQYAPDERYEPYQPYQPFDYVMASTPAPSGSTPVPISRPTRVFVEEVGQSAPASPASATPTDDKANDADAAADDVTPRVDSPAESAPAPRPAAPPTGPLSNPAG